MTRDPHSALDRRSGADRRQRDKGAPGGRERRVGLEPRRPEVQELALTPSQWAALQGGDTVPAALMPEAATVPAALDEARTVVPAALDEARTTVPAALDEARTTVPAALEEADTVPAALSPRGGIG